MRTLCLCLLAAQWLSAQAPRIKVIDFYGLRKVPESRLRKALGAQEGDQLPASKASAEEQLERLDGVVQARLEAVCCEAGGAILFVGIEERGATHPVFRDPPSSDIILSKDVVESYRAFLERFEAAARSGRDQESIARGYALSANPAVRAYQERFVALADGNFAALRRVLRESVEADHRAMAADLIGYASDKKAAVEALQYALQDAEPEVRRNALRALAGIAAFAAANPDAGVRIEPTWAVEMLNSVEWEDRTAALNFLVAMTDKDDRSALDQVRERALAATVEMARWKSLTHALPAFILLGRIEGLTETQIQEAWSKGERETVISKLPPAGKPSNRPD